MIDQKVLLQFKLLIPYFMFLNFWFCAFEIWKFYVSLISYIEHSRNKNIVYSASNIGANDLLVLLLAELY